MTPKQLYLAVECTVVYFLAPASLYFIRFGIAFRILPLIILMGVFAWLYLRRTAPGNRHLLAIPPDLPRQFKDIVVVFVPLALILTLLTYHFLPDKFLAFPRTRPLLWALVMALYPVLAAWPQELFFRALFFERYRPLFTDPKVLLLVNSLSFGAAHALYGNWLAPSLSLAGGLLFGYRYLRTGSVLVTSIEHGLWGNFLFTIGLGWYIYSGSIH